jgi:DNA-binding FadR family transcriptional regulator
VAATAEQGIGRTIAQSLNSMLAADAIELEELLETRMLIEVPLAGLAATRASDEDIAILGGILETGTEDPDRMLDADARFHVEIARIAGDRLASALMLWVGEVLQPPLHRAIEPAIVKPVVLQQHWDILRAIERGDPAEAERGMREHLTYLTDLVGAVRRRFFPNGADPSA